jgi:putative DNA primase/helicase
MRKGLPDAQGLCLPDGALLVPMRSMHTNELQGAQVIRWLPELFKWEKKMIPGMKAKGAVLRLGKAVETILCEGYATGLSIERAARQLRLSAAVLVCFSDSNMVHVAQMLKGPALVFADNDESGAGERAAKATGLPYCIAPTVGWDANDWHVKDGLLPVCAAILKVRQEMGAVVT